MIDGAPQGAIIDPVGAGSKHGRAADGSAGEVVRTRVLGRLAQRFSRRLTLVEAGPGFGKSTLIRQAIHDASADPTTADVVVRAAATGWDDRTLAGHFHQALTHRAATGVPRNLIDAVWARSPVDVCLMIDDVQHLDDRAIGLLDDVVGALPANGHLALVGRRVPDLPAAELLPDHEVLRLGEDDLAFDTDERAMFAARRGIDPDRLTESGWPALLELEWRSGRSGAVRSLIDDAMSGIDPDRLATCRRMAVLDTVDDDMVERLVGTGTSAAELFDGVPLTTSEPGVVRIHDLVRDALVAPLDDRSLRDAHAEVAIALEGRGDDHRAVIHLSAADDLGGLRRLARRIAADVHIGQPTSARHTVAEELRTTLGDCVEVAVLDAAFVSIEDPSIAECAVAQARERARAAADLDLEALCVLRQGELSYGAARLDGVEQAATALDVLARAGSTTAGRLRHLPQIWVRSLTDRHADAVRYVVGTRDDPTLDDATRQLLEACYVMHLGYTGHVRKALAAAADLRGMPGGLIANRLAGFEWIQRWHLGELTRDDLATIVRLLDRIEDLGETHLLAEGLASTALFFASVGDVAMARSLTARAEVQAGRLPPTAWAHHTIAQAHAVLSVFDGDERAAAEILAAAIPPGGIASLPRHVYGLTATTVYVLCPSTRSTWEADEPGPDHRLRLEIARALVALREMGDTTAAASLPWGEPHRLRPWAVEPHLAELAVAAIAGGAEAARGVLEGLQHDPHAHLLRLPSSTPEDVRRVADEVVRLMPRRPAHRITLRVLGEPELLLDGVPSSDPAWQRRQRVRDLLLLLVLHRTIDRHDLAALMWPDKPVDAAARNLRFTLNQLCNVLEPGRSPAEPTWFVRSVGHRLELTVDDRLEIDVDEFDARLGEAEEADRAGMPHLALERLVAACELHRGDYLSGGSDREWGYYEALERRGRFVRAACRAADLLLARGDVEAAEHLAMRAAGAEPDNEPAQRTLAAALLAAGRPGAARELIVAVIERLSAVGLEPDERTRALAIRLGATG